MNRPKVLIISYACNPYRLSEQAIGWNFVKYLSHSFDLTVLTRKKHEESINKYESNTNDSNVKAIKWIYYDLPKPILKFKNNIGTQLYFKLWLALSYTKFRKQFKKEKFDIVNHLNFGIVWMSSPYYRLSDNFIWGPIGGGDLIPLEFMKFESLKSVLRETLYATIVWYGKTISIANRLCRTKSNCIIFRTNNVSNKYLSKNSMIRKYIVCETGFEINDISPVVLDYSSINAVAISRMDYWKGIIYAVKGFQKFLKKGGNGKLTIIGDGNEFSRISKYIENNNLGSHIYMKGKVSYSDYLEYVRCSNVLIYPSFRDGGSFTVLESMAMGIPIICSNNSGPSDMVSEQAGFIIDTNNSNEFIESISNTLFNIQMKPDIAIEKGRMLRKRAEEYYTWEKRGEQLQSIFYEVLSMSKK